MIEITPWVWGIAGLFLAIIEILIPTSFCIWIGLGALCTCVISSTCHLFHQVLDVQTQLFSFGLLSVTCLVIGKMFFKRQRDSQLAPHLHLNRRAEQYIGRIIVLSEDIVYNKAHIILDDTLWVLHGPNCLKGTSMSITGIENSVLHVKKID